MKKIVFALFFLAMSLNVFSQQFSSNEEALGAFVKRTYDHKPFNGVKFIQHNDTNYLVSVVVYSLDDSKNEQVLKRASSLQARANANFFVRDSTVTSEMIMNTTGDTVEDSVKTKSEVVEFLKTTGEGWALMMDFLTSFDVSEGKDRVFVYIRELSK